MMFAADRPRVSVIIPNRNRRELLLRALRSVERQTLRDLEVIVVDDASDVAMGAVDGLMTAAGVRLLRNDRRMGGAVSRNRGVAAARAPYVAFLDSDDYWLPDKLERQLAAARPLGRARYLLAGGLWFLRGDQLHPFTQPPWAFGQPVAEFLYVQGGVLQTSTFFTPTAVAQEIGFDETLPVHQDTDFLLRLEAAGGTIHLLPETLAIMDASPRETRITLDPTLMRASDAWYRRHCDGWSWRVRRGFLRHDRTLRLARSGRRLAALGALLSSLEMPPNPRRLLRDAIAILLGEAFLDDLRDTTRLPAPPPGREADMLRRDDAWAHGMLSGVL